MPKKYPRYSQKECGLGLGTKLGHLLLKEGWRKEEGEEEEVSPKEAEKNQGKAVPGRRGDCGEKAHLSRYGCDTRSPRGCGCLRGRRETVRGLKGRK